MLEVVKIKTAKLQGECQRYNDCSNILRLEKLSLVWHEGDVWLKVDCTIPESCELADLKDYAAEAVGEMAMDTGVLNFMKLEKDLCIVEFSPYECFHQTTCAAPPCMETQVLTESEYAALAEKHENDETLSEEGMRMQRQTRKGESSHE